MPNFLAGDIVLRDYKIEALIGTGGFGEVYRARDLNLDIPVALKVWRCGAASDRTQDEDIRRRFTLEARLGQVINHPHVIRVYKFAPDEATGLLVLVMEYAPGGSLADRLQEGPLPVPEALRIAVQVAAGLAALHAQDVVHRDLKPGNILFDATGQVRVADLGLAQTALSGMSVSTTTGVDSAEVFRTSPGTPAYMSPEQELGVLHLRPASDIHALGLILFEMLTAHSYKSQPPGTRLRALCPQAPRALEVLLARMLAPDPADRPWNGAVAGEALAKLAAQKPSDPDARPGLPCRAVALVGLGGLGLLAVLLLLLTLTRPGGWLSSRTDPEPTATLILLNFTPEDRADPAATRVAAAGTTGGDPGTAGGDLGATGQAAPPVPPAANAAPLTAASPFPAPTVTVPPTAPPTPEPAAPPACLESGQVWAAPVDGMSLVCVPAGNFLMGSTDQDVDAAYDEKPQHTVYLDAFWLDRTEVTNEQFARFVAATGYRTTAEVEGWGYVFDSRGRVEMSGADWRHPFGPTSDLSGRSSHPVVQVSWQDAQAYCAWAGRQLPTEAQWQKAARGGDGRLYPWGNTFDCRLGNFDDEVSLDPYVVPGGTNCDGYPETSPVGAFPSGASPYGLLDMAGNVFEWTADWYAELYYSSQATWQNPLGPPGGDYRVLGGGSWRSVSWNVRTAFRAANLPEHRLVDRGFRCLLAAP